MYVMYNVTVILYYLVLLNDIRNSPHINNLQGRVGRRLNPDHLGVWSDGGGHLGRVGGVNERCLQVQLGGDLPEVAVGPTVQVVHRHDVVPGLEEQGDGVGGGQAAREGDGVLAAVQGGQAGLQDIPGGVSAPAILVSLRQKNYKRLFNDGYYRT